MDVCLQRIVCLLQLLKVFMTGSPFFKQNLPFLLLNLVQLGLVTFNLRTLLLYLGVYPLDLGQ